MGDKIAIYESRNGIQVDVRLENDTVWLNLNQISVLFGKNKSTISRHIKRIFLDGELSEHSVVAKNATTAADGKTYQIEYYNLDMIISIGYRVNSVQATVFRIWATSVLKKYLVDGYAVNQQRLAQQQKNLTQLADLIDLIRSGNIQNQIENLDQARELLNIAAEFSAGLAVLDSYDYGNLSASGRTKCVAAEISTFEFLTEIEKMKSQFGGLFGTRRDDSFESSVRQIYQSVNGRDAYPTIEEKAATLLYLVVKNHSFTDGNKRIAAFCFVYFLSRNDLLFINGRKIIDDSTLAALTLLVAESKPAEMDTIRRVIVTILNNGQK
jgi:prophage maintenance system killer protein